MKHSEIEYKFFKMLDEKFPKGWKPVTSEMYSKVYINTNTQNNPYIEELHIESIGVKISRDGGVNYIEIYNTIPSAYYKNYKELPSSKKYKKIEVVYGPLHGEIINLGSKGYVIEDHFLILVDPSNERVTYHDAYVEISYKDFASSDTVDEFDKLMNEL